MKKSVVFSSYYFLTVLFSCTKEPVSSTDSIYRSQQTTEGDDMDIVPLPPEMGED